MSRHAATETFVSRSLTPPRFFANSHFALRVGGRDEGGSGGGWVGGGGVAFLNFFWNFFPSTWGRRTLFFFFFLRCFIFFLGVRRARREA